MFSLDSVEANKLVLIRIIVIAHQELSWNDIVVFSDYKLLLLVVGRLLSERILVYWGLRLISMRLYGLVSESLMRI